MQEYFLQLIVPKLSFRSEISGRHEHGRRYIVTLQQRFGIVEIIGVAIVKSHDNHVTSSIDALQSLIELPELDRAAPPANDLQVLDKMTRADAQQLGILRQFGDSVIE